MFHIYIRFISIFAAIVILRQIIVFNIFVQVLLTQYDTQDIYNLLLWVL